MAIIALIAAASFVRADDSDEFVRLMNRGKGLIENRESAKAMETIEAALKIRPDSAVGLRNLARACLIADKMDAAIAALERAAKIEPNGAATPYLWGIALAHKTEFEKAAAKFEEAARLDAATPAVRFQLALAYQAAGRDKEALTQFKETARLDPMHAAAWFKLATYARQAGDAAEAQRCTREFTRLRKLFGDTGRNAGTLESCVHTKAEAVGESSTSKLALVETRVRFEEATGDLGDKDVRATAVLECDHVGHPTFILVCPEGELTLLRWRQTGAYELETLDLKLKGLGGSVVCRVGDYHDEIPTSAKYDAKIHALNDVLVLSSGGIFGTAAKPCRLIKQVAKGRFIDSTEQSGLAGIRMRDAVWADADHDGDLDLLAIVGGAPTLYQNNGNGTFTDISRSAGIPTLDGCKRVCSVDFDRNDAIDFVLARGNKPTIVIENKRAGQFAKVSEPPGPWPAADAVACEDLNNDGWPDCVLVREREIEVIYGGMEKRERTYHQIFNPEGVVFADLDNDGQLEIVPYGITRSGMDAIMVFRNQTGEKWQDMTSQYNVSSLSDIDGVVPADFDADGDTDLLMRGGLFWSSLELLRNDGGNTNRQLKLRLLSQKTNASCYGTQVEVRAGDFFTSRRVDSPVVEIGVGPREKLDTVQTVWTNGVVDNQFDVAVTKQPLAILEKNVATGSCPFLYAWDGGRFRFVTDVLGNSPVGLPLRRDFLLPADPEEIVVIGGEDSLKPKDGRFLFDVTSEFLEVLYLDEARLLAVDHPADVEVHVNDKIMAPPFPSSEVWLLKDARVPVSAVGDDGVDRTEAVRSKDDVFAPPGAILPPPYRGMCQPLVITLDFGEMPGAGEPVLALTGWLQYGQASTNIALSQNPDAVVIMPRLEVETSEGVWRPVDVEVGMPAGKTKTILVDLKGKLPAKFRRLRLTNTFEIRWDRIAMFERVAMKQSAVKSLRPMKADLRWRGFSEIRSRAENHPTTPDYENVSQKPPWRSSMEGWCTRYGDVMELTADRDNQLAIVNGGDALRLEFDAAGFAPVASGMRRTYLFYSYGWEKDGDYNVERGDLVETELKQSEKGMKYQTRWVGRDQFRD